ncbi:MAG TPA: bacterioferritin [Candidatus Polarisedimenticolaceae bacterium]|nr:bacterioferritin [Candidatus Polarisedimenticolaceae bacterium]
MKGHPKIIEALNDRLREELTAINQYMVHSEMCENWGYGKLHKAIRAQAMDEMFHAEWLIERIIFLDGAPTVSNLNPMKIGKTVQEMIDHDRDDELDAIGKYNASIKLAQELGDNGTRELLDKILKMEEKHVDWGEEQRDQIAQMGIANYLAIQAAGEGEKD